MLTVIHLRETTSIEDGLNEANRQGRIPVVDVADVIGVLNSSLLINQLEEL